MKTTRFSTLLSAINTTMFAMVFTILSIVAISAFSVLPASAEGDLPRLVDSAGLLSDSEASDLLNLLDEISERQHLDVVIVTVNSLDGKNVVAYADDYYDYNGYGYGDNRDGILLLISMGERDWCLSTKGYGITVFTDAGQEYISDLFVSDLSAGDYAAAFTTFANLCDDYITQANTGEPYDVDNLPKEPFAFGANLITTFVIAFIIALITTAIMKGSLKSVHSQSTADDYMKQGSMKLTRKDDLFLYSHVDRREKPKNDSSGSSHSSHSSGGSSTHTSSSGSTHGGSHGKF